MSQWQRMIHKIVKRGCQRKEIQTDRDPALIATVLISSLEGSLMMSQLYGDYQYLELIKAYLLTYIAEATS